MMQSHVIFPIKGRTRFLLTRASLSLALSVGLLTAAAPTVSRATQSEGGTSQVVLGTIEPDYQFPWVVGVTGSGKGVLIAPQWVLTAAHVVEDPVHRFNGARVNYRRTDPVTGVQTSGSQDTGIGSVFIHPDYLAGDAEADLALVRLPVPFAPDPFLKPAQLPTAAAAEGQEGTVASHSHTEPLPPGHLAVLRPAISSVSTDGAFGASAPDGSVCPGDSGSGFITSSGGLNVVTGIVFRGVTGDCATPNLEFDAVDVFQYLGWIRSTAGIYNAEFYSTDGAGRVSRLQAHGNWNEGWDLIVPGNFGGDGHTDLLFYDRETGLGAFFTTDGVGRIAELSVHTYFRRSWDLIVPGDFGGDGHTDLLFYDRAAGTGEFYATDGAGGIALLATHDYWRGSWDQIIPGSFGGGSHTDLLFYDRAAGTGEFYRTDGAGGIALLATHDYWRASWDIIVPGNFGGDGHTDLLFYDRAAGQGEFHTTDGWGGIAQLKLYSGWRASWDQIIPGDFAGSDATDLVFYDRAAGIGEFYRNRGAGRFTRLRTHSDWRTSWSPIVAGNFGENSWTDLLFYQP